MARSTTGDLGRLDDKGRLYVIDRRTDRIVRGGENISPAEVEAVLLAQPSIADAAVVARRDEALGQVPVAAIVVRPDAADPGDDAISCACRRSLAGFKVPAAISGWTRCRGPPVASSGGTPSERSSATGWPGSSRGPAATRSAGG